MGGTSTISSNASSPDGRSLTYSYAASAGSITGNTSTATLDSTGAQPGTITVTCNVSDDRNPPLTASFTTTVTVQAHRRRVNRHTGSYRHREEVSPSTVFILQRPSLRSKIPMLACLPVRRRLLATLASDFQTYLQSKPDARLTLEGHADPRGSRNTIRRFPNGVLNALSASWSKRAFRQQASRPRRSANNKTHRRPGKKCG